uniref:Signal recognition particle 19 kDa protein n=1 Tax=Schistocephalus solidus TaxID=70667 RepID=A0A183TGW6_SCHSO
LSRLVSGLNLIRTSIRSQCSSRRWICIYPVYINSRVPRSRGRKVSVEQAVDNPKHTEICAILQNIGIQHLAENKVYSRERDPAETQTRWRIRVQLKNDDGSLTNEQFPTRHSLLLYLGKTIPMLKSRHSGGQGSDQVPYKGKKGKRR